MKDHKGPIGLGDKIIASLYQVGQNLTARVPINLHLATIIQLIFEA